MSVTINREQWEPHPTEPTQTQTGWLFYAVTRIRGVYVPIAVTAFAPKSYEMTGLPSKHLPRKVSGVLHGHQIATSALACLAILSDPANRPFVLAEMDMASEYYADGSDRLLPAASIPGKRVAFGDASTAKFPFIQACLSHGASTDFLNSRQAFDCWITLSLSTVYHRNPFYGAVVIDLTDPENIGYGIIASKVNNLVSPGYNIKYEGTTESPGHFKQVLAADQGRNILNVNEYLRLADNDGSCCSRWAEGRIEADIQALAQCRTIGLEAIQAIWPDGVRTVEALQPSEQQVNVDFDLALRGLAPGRIPGDSLSWLKCLEPFRPQFPALFRDRTVPRARDDGDDFNNCFLDILGHKFDLEDDVKGDVCIVRPQNMTMRILEETLNLAPLPDAGTTVSVAFSALQGEMTEGGYVPQLLEQAKTVYALRLGGSGEEKDVVDVRRAIQDVAPTARVVFSDMYSPLPASGGDEVGFTLAVVDRVFYHRLKIVMPFEYARADYFDVGHWQLGAEAWVARLLGWLQTGNNKNGRSLACGPVRLDDMNARAMSPDVIPIGGWDKDVFKTHEPRAGKWMLVVMTHFAAGVNGDVGYAFVRRRPGTQAGDDNMWQVESARGFLDAEAPGKVSQELLDKELNKTQRAIIAWPKLIQNDQQHERNPLHVLKWSSISIMLDELSYTLI